jgi:hypothetical protein
MVTDINLRILKRHTEYYILRIHLATMQELSNF